LKPIDWDLYLVDILSAALILATAFAPDSPLRIVLGLPFVLFFPGYTLICLLFPRRRDLDYIERIALSLGLSITVVPLIGLALNYTPWGIRLYPILVSLFTFTISTSIAAMYRRRSLPAGERFAPLLSFKIPRLEWRLMGKVDKILSVGLIASVVAAGVTVVYVATTPKVGERFTEFYVLGLGGKIADYPTNLTLGESGTVILGVVNHEYEDVTYRILVRLDNVRSLLKLCKRLSQPNCQPEEYITSALKLLKLERETGINYKKLLKDYEDKLAERARLLEEIEKLKVQTVRLTDDIGKLEIEKSRLEGELERFKLTLSEAEAIAKLKAQFKLYGVELEDLNTLRRVMEGVKELNYNPKAIVEAIANIGSLVKLLEELEKNKKSLIAEIENLKKLKQEVIKEFPTPIIENPNGSMAAVIPNRIIKRKDGTVEIEYFGPNRTFKTISFKSVDKSFT